MNTKYYYILLLLLFSNFFPCSTEASDINMPGNFKNPQAVKEVLSGKRTVANAAWWGFDKDDSTAALQGAINSGASKVIVPCMGSDWIVRPIKLASNQEIYFEPGVVVEAMSNKAKSNSFIVYFDDWNTKKNKHRRGDALFIAICKSNIILRGYGAMLRMQKREYLAEPKTSEYRHVVDLRSCSNITIQGLTIGDSGGDGIHIGRYHQYPGVKYYCENIVIKDVTCDNNLRCGIAVISVDGLTIENCVLKNTTGAWPQCGIDFEPNFSAEKLKNIVMRDTTISNNGSLGLIISLHNLNSNSSDVNMLFEDLYLTDASNSNPTSYAGIMASHTGNENGPKGLVTFKNVTLENVATGLIVEKSKNSYFLSFENCIWKDVKNQSPIIIQTRKQHDSSYPVQCAGGVYFMNCRVFDNENRPAIKSGGDIQRGQDGLYEIHGNLHVTNPKRVVDLYDWNGARLYNVDVTVFSSSFANYIDSNDSNN